MRLAIWFRTCCKLQTELQAEKARTSKLFHNYHIFTNHKPQLSQTCSFSWQQCWQPCRYSSQSQTDVPVEWSGCGLLWCQCSRPGWNRWALHSSAIPPGEGWRRQERDIGKRKDGNRKSAKLFFSDATPIFIINIKIKIKLGWDSQQGRYSQTQKRN